MSSGVVHTRVTLGISGVLLVSSLILRVSPELAIGAVTTVMINPDLDVDAGSITDYFLRRLGRVGWVLEKAWDVFWWPYRKSLKHGGPLSHWPGVSTLGRVGYIALLLLVLPYAAFSLYYPSAEIWADLWWWLAWFYRHSHLILGMMVPDTAHFILDIATTEHKRGYDGDYS